MILVRMLFLSASMILLAGVSPGQVVPRENITASASSEFISSLTGASLTIDGSGLSGDGHDAEPSGHSMWLSALGGGGTRANNPADRDGPAWLHYRFSSPIALDQVFIWNHNQPGLTDRGLRNVHIDIRKPASPWESVGNYTIPQAPGTAGYLPEGPIPVNASDVSELLITAARIDGNYGSDYFGLSEIRFVGSSVPCWPPQFEVQVESIAMDEGLDLKFSAQPQGWLGSDIAKSIPLGDGRVLWLFGDTFIGELEGGARKPGAKFINNSIAIQDPAITTGDDTTFYWGPGDTSFFPHEPGTPGELYWPTSGFMLDGELFIFCYSVAGFLDIRNTTLIRVTNPLSSPTEWNWTVVDFSIGGPNLGFHTAFYPQGDHMMMLGYADREGTRSAVLGRMLKEDLLAGLTAEAMEFWANTDQGPGWGNSTDNLVPLFSPGVTESDLIYLPEFGLYVTTAYNPFQRGISLVFARNLTGPWSEPLCLYNPPEYDAVPFDIISYAARPHEVFLDGDGGFVLSYATNTFGTLDPLFTTAGVDIYVPKFIRVKLDPRERHSWMVY